MNVNSHTGSLLLSKPDDVFKSSPPFYQMSVRMSLISSVDLFKLYVAHFDSTRRVSIKMLLIYIYIDINNLTIKSRKMKYMYT